MAGLKSQQRLRISKPKSAFLRAFRRGFFYSFKKNLRASGGLLLLLHYKPYKTAFDRTMIERPVGKWVSYLLLGLMSLSSISNHAIAEQGVRQLVENSRVLSSSEVKNQRGEPVFDLSIPPLNAAEALNELVRQTGAQVLFSYQRTRQYQARSIVGRYTLQQALVIVLQDSGLESSLSEGGVISIYQQGMALQKNNEGKSDMKSKKKLLAGIVAFLGGSMGGQAVMAQDADVAGWLLEEVVVTARFREESAQDIGMAMHAISGENLVGMGITDLKDIIIRTPGLDSNSRGPNKNDVTMRGMASPLGVQDNTRSNSLIGLYLDDVSIASAYQNQRSIGLDDMARVEIVKGPQGTLYGEGAVGGAVRYVTANPILDQFEAIVRATISDTDSAGDLSTRFSATVNLPVIENKLGVRLTAFDEKSAGFIDFTGADADSATPGAELIGFPQDDANEDDSQGVRLVLLLNPNDNLLNKLSITKEKYEADVEWAINTDDKLENTTDFMPEFQKDDMLVVSNRLDYTVESGVFSSVTGVTERNRDYDGMERASSLFGLPLTKEVVVEEESISQEFRFVSALDGPTNFLLGAYYKKVDTLSTALLFDSGVVGVDYEEVYDNEQLAVFGEMSFAWSDSLTTTLGGRYFKDDFETEQTWNDTEGLFGGISPTTTFFGDSTIEAFLPKVLVEYQYGEDALFYASAGKGARNGGSNVIFTTTIVNALGGSVPLTYEDDSVWSYEIGAKYQSANRRLIANIAAYYNDFSDLQTFVGSEPIVGVSWALHTNAGDAFSQGVETEISYEFSEVYSAYFAANMTSSELKEDYTVDSIAGSVVKKGAELPNVPEYTVSAGADMRYPLSGMQIDANFVAHLDLQLIGQQAGQIKVTPENPVEPFYEIDAYEILNLRLGLDTDRWSLQLFADNLLNKQTLLARRTDYITFYTNRPRTVGLSLSASF